MFETSRPDELWIYLMTLPMHPMCLDGSRRDGEDGGMEGLVMLVVCIFLEL